MARPKERAFLQPPADGPLDKRVLDLMSGFPGPVSFAGLRRTLEIHQESLTRALKRLERSGSVERTVNGYRLSEQFLPHPNGEWEGTRFPREGDKPMVDLRLLTPGDKSGILGSLAGRWFGEFRWVGSYEDGRRTTLLWVSSAGNGFLGLVLEGNRMSVYHQPVSGMPVQDQPPAAYELIEHVMRALGDSDVRAPAGTLHVSAAVPRRIRSDIAE